MRPDVIFMQECVSVCGYQKREK